MAELDLSSLVATFHGDADSDSFREGSVEIIVGPNAVFENGAIGAFARQVPENPLPAPAPSANRDPSPDPPLSGLWASLPYPLLYSRVGAGTLQMTSRKAKLRSRKLHCVLETTPRQSLANR